MKVFFVLRLGVYQQGVFGVFDELQKAVTHAHNSIFLEHDNYHDFFVYETEMNTAFLAGEYGVQSGLMVAHIKKDFNKKITVELK